MNNSYCKSELSATKFTAIHNRILSKFHCLLGNGRFFKVVLFYRHLVPDSQTIIYVSKVFCNYQI